MNFKLITTFVFIFSILLIASNVFAVDCTADNVGEQWTTDDETCVCEETVETNSDGTVETNYGSLCAITAVSDVTDSAEITSADIDETSCKEDIKNINTEIRSITKSHAVIIKKIRELTNHKNTLKQLTNRYRMCVHRINSAGMTNSPMSGNLTFYNNVQEAATLSTADVQIESTYVDSSTTEVDDQAFDNIEIESRAFLESISSEVSDVEAGTDVKPTCADVKQKINENKEKIRLVLTELKTYKEEHEADLIKVRELIQKRNKLFKECYPKATYDIKENCVVPQSLLDKKVEYENKLNTIKENIVGVTEETSDSDQITTEYKKYKLEYNLINKKISTIRKECTHRATIAKDVKNICDEKMEILNRKKELSRDLEDAVDEEKIYELKRQLSYLNDKFNKVVCVNVTETVMTDTEISSQGKPPIHANAVEACTKNLMEKDQVSEDMAAYACKQKFNQEDSTYKKRIKALETKIKVQNTKIKSLEQIMKNIRNQYKETTSEDRKKFIEDNAEDILNDTVAKIEQKVAEVETTIEEIEMSDMIDEKRTEVISKLNQRIAHLDLAKENIQTAETVDDFKKHITKAKEYDLKAKKERIISLLQKDLSKLDLIIDKYFTEHTDYELLKSNVDELDSEFSLIDADTVSSDEVESIRNKYNELKNKLKTYAGGANE